MYWGDNSIGCLNVTTELINKGILAETSRIGSGLRASSGRIGKGIQVACSVICSVNKDAYLRVSPDVVWLTPDMVSGEFDIYSNVIWRID